MILDWFEKRRLKKELSEKRSLPVGMTEFEQWSLRIMRGAGLPATRESQQWTLAAMVASLPPTTAYESDGYFINALKKAAATQVAQAKMEQLHAAKSARAAEEKAKAEVPADEDPQPSDHATL